LLSVIFTVPVKIMPKREAKKRVRELRIRTASLLRPQTLSGHYCVPHAEDSGLPFRYWTGGAKSHKHRRRQAGSGTPTAPLMPVQPRRLMNNNRYRIDMELKYMIRNNKQQNFAMAQINGPVPETCILYAKASILLIQ
jgi:hypothetical protein